MMIVILNDIHQHVTILDTPIIQNIVWLSKTDALDL